MKIIQFQPQQQIVVDSLGNQRPIMKMWGLGDDNKIYLYDFTTQEWIVFVPEKPKKAEDKKILS